MRIRAQAAWIALGLSAGWNISNCGAAADTLADSYSVPLGVVGLFTTALFLTHAIMQIPAGRLCDRFGARSVGCLGLLITAVASLATVTWQDARFAILLRAIAGVGTALSFVAGSDYARTTGSSAVIQGYYGAVSMLGGGVALAVIPRFDDWRVPFLSAAAIGYLGAITVATAPPDPVRPSTVRGSPLLRDVRLARYGLMHAASFGLSVVVANWIVTLLDRHSQASASVAGAIGGLTLVLGVLTRPLGGRLDRRSPVLRGSFLVGALGVSLLALTSSVAVAVVGAALVGLAAGLPFATAFAAAARERPDAPAAAVGLVNVSAALTILIATPLVGLTFALPGAGRIGFVVVGGLWALAAFSVPRRIEER